MGLTSQEAGLLLPADDPPTDEVPAPVCVAPPEGPLAELPPEAE